MEAILADVRYGLRVLLNDRVFTVVAVLTLALGIGATTAIFSVVYGVMLDPLSFRDPERVVRVLVEAPPGAPGGPGGVGPRPIPLPRDDFYQVREQVRSLESLSMVNPVTLALTGIEQPVRLSGASVTPELFPMLGATPLLGRSFEPEEAVEGNDGVVLIGESMWERQFGRDGDILGRTIVLDDEPYAVVGVMPDSITLPGPDIEFWVPLALPPPAPPVPGRILISGDTIARIAEGYSREEALAELETVIRRLHPGERPSGPAARPQPGNGGGAPVFRDPFAGARVFLIPIQEDLVAPVRPALLVLLGAVAFVLLIASANVANLLLTRASGRRLEMAIRVALGAGRMRVVRQVLTESIVLAIAGGAFGTLLAYGGVRVLKAIQPGTIPRMQDIDVNAATLMFALAVSVLTGVLFGLAPALRLASHERVDALKEGGLFASSGFDLFRRNRARSLLAMAAVALAVVLLIGGGLLIGSFGNLAAVDPGFDVENILTFQLRLSPTRHPEFAEREMLYTALLERIRGMSGVTSAGAVSGLPLTPGITRVGFRLPGETEPVFADLRLVTPGYFDTMGIDLVEGRGYDDQDPSGVLVVNETFARTYFPDGALDREFQLGPPGLFRIVGIVEDIRHQTLSADPQPEAYLNYRYTGGLPFANAPLHLAVRTSADPLALLPRIRTAVLDLDPSLPLDDVMTMEQRVSTSIAGPRFYAAVLGIFAAIALVLASVGIYGVLAYAVTQRTREIGIRMALGAGQGNVLKLILGQGLVLVVVGVVVGLGGAFALTRYLDSMLYGLTPLDPVTFGGMTLVLFLTALVACYVPARRATRVDPLIALRHE